MITVLEGNISTRIFQVELLIIFIYNVKVCGLGITA